MAATYDWVGGVDGDFSDKANLNPSGNDPIADDTVRMVKTPTNPIDSGQAAWSAIKLHIIGGPDYKGTLGVSGTPMTFGANSTLKLNIPNVTSSYWNIASGGIVTILNTAVDPNACVLQGGTFAELNVQKAPSLILGASATFTLARLLGRLSMQDIVATIESGATVTKIEVNGAVVDCEAAIVTLEMLGGIWNHKGATNFDITTLNLHGGVFNAEAHGMTIGNLDVRGGYFDARKLGFGTLSAGIVRTGGVVDLRNEGNNISKANLILAGGQILGGVGEATFALPPAG